MPSKNCSAFTLSSKLPILTPEDNRYDLGSTRCLRYPPTRLFAGVTQLAECRLSKPNVEGSTPFARFCSSPPNAEIHLDFIGPASLNADGLHCLAFIRSITTLRPFPHGQSSAENLHRRPKRLVQ